jgi:heme o synthase
MKIWYDYWQLTKPRVTQLAVFCAIIGMLLVPNQAFNISKIILSAAGIWLLAASAFACNCLFEASTDAKMLRTAKRASANQKITTQNIILFSIIIGGLGTYILYVWVNPLTMWLTLATFFGYAFIYTLLLKPTTPQNIVIGGLSGAMPPALGWAAIDNQLAPQAWLLVLIIFCWTPPHFWALSLYRTQDYIRSNLPMLPVTHGAHFTCLHMLLYTYVLAIATLLPYLYGMSGLLYLLICIPLNMRFIYLVHKLYTKYSDELAKRIFKFSILYLSLLFLGLLCDYYSKYII